MGLTRGQLVAIVVSITVVVALVLGLGLGLGLRDKDNPPSPGPEATECYAVLHKKGSYYDPSIPWSKQCAAPGNPQCPGSISPPLLLISMDGFRADYLSRGITPTISRLQECGASTPYLRSVFPTKTFPAHYSIATGLYTESTGIVGNKMYDMQLEEQFSLGSENSFKGHWWNGEPIWNTVTKEGKQSVTLFWPGSEAPIQDMKPNHCYKYNESIPFEDRVNEIIGYFDGDPATFPSLVTFYLHEPDSAGHDSGPYGEWLTSNLTYVDNIIQKMLSGLEQKGLHQCVNIMLVADHGMEGIDCDWTVGLQDYINPVEDSLYVYDGEYVRITSQYIEQGDEIVHQPDGASPDEILSKLQCQHYNSTRDWYVRFDKKEHLPKRLHYANSHRIEEIVGDVEKSYLVFIDDSYVPSYQCHGGAHGYDNIHDSMHAIFVGFGPGFHSGIVTEPFESIELYNVMADLLELKEPAPNNGTKGSLHHILSRNVPLPEPPEPLSDYEDCLFPNDPQEVINRRNHSTTCNWWDVQNFTNTPVETLDSQLDLTPGQQTDAISTHLPFGVPLLNYEDADLCQLVQTDYVMGYSHRYKMPLWSGFQLRNNPDCTMLNPDCSRTAGPRPSVVRPDVRLSTEQHTECSSYTNSSQEISGQYLFSPGLIDVNSNPDQDFDGHISTNLVPMYDSFRTGVWQRVLDLLEEYSEKYGDLHVVAGPVFDYDADGHRDDQDIITSHIGSVPVPTHYYLVASKCDTAEPNPLVCADNNSVMALILPHRPQPGNCWDVSEDRYMSYISKHVARVRDIELLTELRFFPAVPEQRRLHMVVHLTEDPWDRISWMDLRLNDTEECPELTRPATCPPGYNSQNPPVLLVSIDGFKPDYLNQSVTPTLQKLKSCGSSAEYMRSILPTMTFPNHYTITSGMYPESHGIVDNNMYDMNLRQAFWLGSPNANNAAWWTGEPMWNNVMRNNKTAMAFFWPGSDVEIGGMRPTRYKNYNGNTPYSLRVSTVLDWLRTGADGKMPDFITLYFSNVDSAGHEGGPGSLLVTEALVTIDHYIKQLMDGINRQGLSQCINLIITSDHGMTDIACEWSVILNDHIDMYGGLRNKTYVYHGSAARMGNTYYRVGNNYHHIAEADRVPKESIIKDLTCKDQAMNVFDKAELPKRHHYANSDRIEDIIFMTDDRWMVQRTEPWCGILGQHGWDPFFETMKAYFSAFGPGFKDKSEVGPFENIEVYNMLNNLVGITPGPNNGTEGSLHHILHTPPPLDALTGESYDSCVYPSSDTDYERRANLTTAQCTCVPPAGNTIKELDGRLNKSTSEQTNLEAQHIPHGRPLIATGASVCVLHHDNFVTGFDKSIKVAAWTGFTLDASQGTTLTPPDCIRPDVRMEQEEQASCADYQMAAQANISAGFMFPPAWSADEPEQMDTLTLTNVAPMFLKFKSGIWQRLLYRLSSWADTFTTLHIITGPVFDHNADGRKDANMTWVIDGEVPLPSHYYLIALKCPQSDCSTTMEYDPLTFILPHKENITNCMTEDQYLLDNVARMRDVELLTDLNFLTNHHTQAMVRTRTFIPVQLW